MTYFNQDNQRSGRRSFGGRRDFGGRGGGDRQMYPAVCAACGRDCQVPFFPDGSKPVYCSDCFGKNQAGSDKRQYTGGGGGKDLNKELLVSINSKLGKILELMSKANKPELKEVKKTEKKVKKAKKVKSEV